MSPLRAKQVDRTRAAILDAIAAQAAAGGIREFTNRAVARAAGVSERTLYRHFPSQDALLDGLGNALRERLKVPPPPRTIDELPDVVEEGFRRAKDLEPWLRAMEMSAAWRSRRTEMHRRGSPMLARLLAPLCRGDDVRRASAVIDYLLGARSWLTLRDEFGMTPDESGATLAWAVRTFLSGLRHDRGRS